MRTESKTLEASGTDRFFCTAGQPGSRYRHRSRLCADLAGAEGRVPVGMAMDVRKGPLERAEEHVEEVGLSGKLNCACQTDWQN